MYKFIDTDSLIELPDQPKVKTTTYLETIYAVSQSWIDDLGEYEEVTCSK